MKISEDEVHGLELQTLVTRLRALGAGLAGRNLMRASWLDIARALRRRVPGNQLLVRLRAAKTREDALRILRVARTFERDGRRAGGNRKARGTGAPGRHASAPVHWHADTATPREEQPHRHDDFCTCFRTDTFPFDFRVWQAWELLTGGGNAASVAENLAPAMRDALELATRGQLSGVHIPIASTLQSSRTLDAVEYLGAVFSMEKATDRRFGSLPTVTQHDLDALLALCPVPGARAGNRDQLEFFEHRLFVMALLLAPLWLRAPRTWPRPAAQGGEKIRSLVDHLFVEYPVPRMMYEAWNVNHESAGDPKAIACFVLLGRGMALKAAGPRLGWRFPGRFVHWLGQVPAQLEFRSGLLWAEVMRLGGSEVEFCRLRRWRVFLEIDPTGPSLPVLADPRAAAAEHEPRLQFLRDTIRWLIRHREALTETTADEILCWASARHMAGLRPTGQRFHWDGRTPRSAIAAAAAWFARGQEDEAQLTWASREWNWTGGVHAEWRVQEILSSNQLFIEGFALGHCVASYATDCHRGLSAVFALYLRGERQLTVEVDPQSRMIRQAKGLGNRNPTVEENDILESWLREAVWTRHEAPP
jgi:hypothetical protein